jgi:hypothetical protein
MYKMEEKIDFVVTWVDGNDPEWQNEKQRFMSDNDKKLNSDSRYRDWDIFKYWFRAVEEHAPWVNKVFLITEGHIPSWLNVNHEKLTVIKHSDYIPNEYLPTFNSNVIELNIHRISELSEYFVLFNDDMFINKPVRPNDFFKSSMPLDTGIFSPQVPKRGGIASITLNNIEIINDYFNTYQVLKQWGYKFFKLKYGKHLLKNMLILPWKNILGFYDNHIPISYDKKFFEIVFDKEPDLLDRISTHRFRQKDDINHWLIRYWQICSGNFIPRSTCFGNYYDISIQLNEIENEILEPVHSIICLNDGESVTNFEHDKLKLVKTFEMRYPRRSSFEKGME